MGYARARSRGTTSFARFRRLPGADYVYAWIEMTWQTTFSKLLPGSHPIASLEDESTQAGVRRLRRRLADSAGKGIEGQRDADAALIELLRLDPRYFLSPLLGAKILWW